jgi:LacI family transcriptional regulator
MPHPEYKHIALVLPTRLPENVGILEGIAAYERAHTDWSFFLDDQAMGVKNPDWLLSRPWDGIICRHLNPRLLEECVRRGIPCVDLEDTEIRFPGIPKLRPDNLAIGHTGGEHFIERGFRHFGFCGFSSESWSTTRRKGFVEAVETVGYECAVMETVYTHELAPVWDLQEQALIQEWLSTLPRPVAILSCNDMRALQVVEAAHNLGIAVPEEISILGVNNETCRVQLAHPALSSIPVNIIDWGYKGAGALDCLINGQPFPTETFIEPLPVVIRRSTDVFAVDDPVIANALRIIHEEACGALRVDDLARRVNVSRSVLERRFRKLLRRSPQEEIRSIKINMAKQLMMDTDKSMAEIAELTGFEHPEYLSVMFKRLTGEAPRDFRLRARQLEH